ENLKFSAGLSADPRGGEVDFGWDFGDNKILFGKEAVYSFATSGLYKITLSATSTVSTTDKYQFNIKIGAGLKWNITGIRFYSLLSDPLDKDSQEYVTIINTGSSTVNLAGWQLHTINADKNYFFPEGTMITPSGTLTFFRLATKLTLNNEGEELELLNLGQEVVDQIKYTKTKKGEVQNFLTLATSSSSSTLVGNLSPENLKPISVIKKTTKKSANYINFSNTTIADAREKAKNTGVVVTGIVTVEPKTFGVQYFYMADEFNGIQVYNFKKQFPDLKTGDKITVRGVTSESSGQKRIKTNGVVDIDILSTTNKMETRIVELSEVGDDTAGALVQITGDITEIKTNYMYLDDGEGELVVYFKKGAQIDEKKFKEGDKVTVVGIVEVTKTAWQVWPRSDSDIVVIGQSAEVLAKTMPIETGSTGTYISAALGAATTMLLGFLARARGAVLLVMGKKVFSIAVGLIKRG
ncbi:MAG: lamin tail domain-containing protein, partial [bacterium]|nr:lamin tail domain-containing protein [bacterium]